jgi:hypothetical protein
VWAVTSGEVNQTIKVTKGTGALAFSADGNHLFIGQTRTPGDAQPGDAEDVKPIRRIDLKTGKEVQTWKALPAEKRENEEFVKTTVLALLPLLDKATLVVIEGQNTRRSPPPRIPQGGRIPTLQHLNLRVIDLPGRSPDKVMPLAESLGEVSVTQDGSMLGHVVTTMLQQPMPQQALALQLVKWPSGQVRELVIPGTVGRIANPLTGMSFRPGTKEVLISVGDGQLVVVNLEKLSPR